MTLVIDCSVLINSLGSEDGLRILADDDLVAPPLLWSEARSTLHLALVKGKVSAEDAAIEHERLETCPVRVVHEPKLGRETWRIAEQFGSARTYDADYVALAQILGCRLVTLDGRLRGGADRLGFVVTPEELLDSEQPSEAPDTDD